MSVTINLVFPNILHWHHILFPLHNFFKCEKILTLHLQDQENFKVCTCPKSCTLVHIVAPLHMNVLVHYCSKQLAILCIFIPHFFAPFPYFLFNVHEAPPNLSIFFYPSNFLTQASCLSSLLFLVASFSFCNKHNFLWVKSHYKGASLGSFMICA